MATNFEYYKDEILRICNSGEMIGLCDGVPAICRSMRCVDCGFRKDDRILCIVECIKWLYEEYKEPIPKLTPKERAFCEITKVGYIARNKFGSLYSFFVKPTREGEDWCSNSSYRLISAEYFQFIKWEDEPWSIKDLLKLEVE